MHSNQASSNCLSHNNPARGWPYKFRSKCTTGSSMLAHGFGHSCRGSRIHSSGYSDSEILSNLGASSNFTWVSADTASAACPSQSGNLATTSITFSAVIWDADEPCSVKTAKAPESPRSTTLPLYLWNFGSNSAFLRWHTSINVAKWTFFLSLCASRITPSCFWFFPISMLRSSRAFSILYPLQLLHPEFWSLVAYEWTCVPSCNATSMQCGLHGF